ncbi:hypothetical protein [Salinicola rhizosphaerae]|uniref:Uncharacterized protein n=1 Tax=Salinicola rhizosphaerae TaxID=1443141 RepID=A0ABQ3E805_9GAMM|nr:hypothetical protein [Salinicola rhizosphaerae]GHB23995.1 hypothetical protein GCM10009038_23740 [Salinicola rhizosphaerae]
MMIAELIDGEDFRQRLIALGVHVPEEACPETCARLAAGCHRTRGVEGLEASIRELMQHTELMLPSVKAAIEAHLLPTFSGR